MFSNKTLVRAITIGSQPLCGFFLSKKLKRTTTAILKSKLALSIWISTIYWMSKLLSGTPCLCVDICLYLLTVAMSWLTGSKAHTAFSQLQLLRLLMPVCLCSAKLVFTRKHSYTPYSSPKHPHEQCQLQKNRLRFFFNAFRSYI